MKYEIIGGKVNENPSNEKKRKIGDQEAHIELEDFDYSSPQLSSSEDLLKVMIKKVYMKNDNQLYNSSLYPRHATTTRYVII